MTVWDVTFTALQPISIAQQVNAQSQWATTNFIPGSTWRGAVAEHWKYAVGFEDALAQTFINECIFHDAHEKQTQFTPVYWKGKKGTNDYVNILHEYIENDVFMATDGERAFIDIAPFQTDIFENSAIGIEMSRTRESTVQGKFYSMTSIAEGTEFTTTAKICEEVMQKIAPNHELTVYIGKKRFSGYGKTKIKFTPRGEQQSLVTTYTTKEGKIAVVFAAKSATILYDAYLRPTQTIDWSIHIAPLLPSSLQQLNPSKEETWGVGAIRSGWQQLWNAPKTDEHVLAAGAAYIVTFEQATEEQLKQLVHIIEVQGIGERVQEGFGQFVQAPMTMSDKLNRTKEQLRLETSRFTSDEEGKLYEAAQQLVEAFGVNKQDVPNVPLAQWHALMNLRHKDSEIFSEDITKYMSKRLNSPVNKGNFWKNEFTSGVSNGEKLRQAISEVKKAFKCDKRSPCEINIIIGNFLTYCARATRTLKLGGNQHD